jgi:hypothetical protein
MVRSEGDREPKDCQPQPLVGRARDQELTGCVDRLNLMHAEVEKEN